MEPEAEDDFNAAKSGEASLANRLVVNRNDDRRTDTHAEDLTAGSPSS